MGVRSYDGKPEGEGNCLSRMLSSYRKILCTGGGIRRARANPCVPVGHMVDSDSRVRLHDRLENLRN